MLTPQRKKSQELTEKQQDFLDAYFAEGEKPLGISPKVYCKQAIRSPQGLQYRKLCDLTL